jgi:hypothetical protein
MLNYGRKKFNSLDPKLCFLPKNRVSDVDKDLDGNWKNVLRLSYDQNYDREVLTAKSQSRTL